MPAVALRREAGRLRDLAVTMVDGKHGCRRVIDRIR